MKDLAGGKIGSLSQVRPTTRLAPEFLRNWYQRHRWRVTRGFSIGRNHLKFWFLNTHRRSGRIDGQLNGFWRSDQVNSAWSQGQQISRWDRRHG